MGSWKEHVAAYRKKHDVTFKAALSAAGPSWKDAKTQHAKSESKLARHKSNHVDDAPVKRTRAKVKTKREKEPHEPCGCGGH